MMTTDVRALMDRTPFDHSAVADLREVLGRDPSRYRTLRDAVAAMRDRDKGAVKPETHLRLGVGEVMLGRYATGLDHLAKAGRTSSGAGRWSTSSAGARRPRRSPPPPRRATSPRSPSCTAPAPCAAP